MDFMKDNEDICDEDVGKNELFFVEDCGSSEDDGEVKFSQQDYQFSRLRRESSPLVLAFPSGHGTIPSVDSEEEDEEQNIEDWMILGRDAQLGDSNIQLNLSYWNSDEDSGEEDEKEKDAWLVSEKDKSRDNPCLPSRYFGLSLICNICNKTGHLAKSCYYQKKCPICILCGTQGHIQRDCPGRPCSSCGLPSHGFTRCDRPPMWNQHCQRCGMAGHLSDACPDTWRQYHLTIRLGVPTGQHPVHSLKHKSLPHCYNCSERGHYGYECTKKRMISGTSPSLPYVSHYDTNEDLLQNEGCRIQKTAKEVMSSGSPNDQRYPEPRQGNGEESHTEQGRSRTKQETCSRTDRRKTWPEKRRERREVKRLRREAQARWESGLMGRSRGNLEEEVDTAVPFRSPLHGQCTVSPRMKMGNEGGRRTRKSRETERFKRRRGIKHDWYPSSYMSSLEQRVRHRRR